MKPEVAKIWVDALRSGEYTQGKQALKFTGADGGECYHCCLGVLCELYDKHNEENLTRNTKYNLDKIVLSFDMQTELLPEKVREWAGLDNVGGWFGDHMGKRCSLAIMNDAGYSFEEIADTIEKNVENL